MIRYNKGCDNGFPDVQLQYLHQVNESGGLHTSEEYPYTTNKDGRTTYQVGTCQEKILREGRAVVSNYQWKYFADEDDLMRMIQEGPVVTNLDVVQGFQDFSGNTVWFSEDCVNYEDDYELIKQTNCTGKNGKGYTCLGDCKDKLPKYCDR